MSDPADSSSSRGASGRPRRALSAPAGLGLLALAAAAVFVLLRDNTPPLTRAVFEAQQARWIAAGISDYELEVRVAIDGQGETRYGATVRGGKTVASTLDGRAQDPPRPEWSVAGIYDTIERELEIAEALARGQREPGQPESVTLRAEFDPSQGLPRRFKRLASGGKSVFFDIVRLEAAVGR